MKMRSYIKSAGFWAYIIGTQAAMLFFLAACTTTPALPTQAQLDAIRTQAIADGRLFCAIATANGPMVVAVVDAASGGKAIPVMALTSAGTTAICAGINAIPVSPPANVAQAPTVAVDTSKIIIPAS